jgi:plasmid maintenance system antidote protein VapI
MADLLDERNWSQAEFALRIGYTKKHVNLLIQGKVPVTEDAAIKLERVLGGTVGFWLNREALYRETLARKEGLNQLNDSVPWLKQLPLKDMIKFGWIKTRTDKKELVAECLKFFGVASVAAWEEKYQSPSAAFRASKSAEKHKGATSAWLRQGERRVSGISCKHFNRAAFRSALEEARNLSQEEQEKIFIPRLIQICANAGVALAIVRAPKGCPVSGSARWMSPQRALIILSDRYKTNDQFWFSFFHEAGHLLLHGKRLSFIDVKDQLDDSHEQDADNFASHILIPHRHIQRLFKLPKSEKEIRAFAQEIGISPGIVVGRMQKENLLPWSHLNALKTKIKSNDSDVRSFVA